MTMRRSPLSMPLLAAALLVFIGSLSSVTSFTVTPSSRAVPTYNTRASPISGKTLPHHPLHPIQISSATASPTSLQMNFTPPENNTGGLREGKYILILAMIANVWLFSIPTEFRRARFCTEEDVKLYPEKHCTTVDLWKAGVADYYANGGGVHFDFSIEGKE
mmetsp:Transcript_11828/g.21001  ORF Transcript_11828/g.21001 Transcript_11828/m.21001 type:complete len:162 (+) Transcript_11828:84-569(+)|eukprot:CAMPEP_0201869554 /NCGR_PEP_ID=MMETSP0902-20130614/3028_1 /ASSEMBLY_ACC=CAM_ASM_000551 /TAXON_ID=420261 /ORGANISM="Thalassiosira antarctica, Strain CCMP982" /LENGTH=161 /DNA_ID=CAMNT_0048395081 /DNA_START=20 /DNA_END=505 /DNA_ORIENTATION=+